MVAKWAIENQQLGNLLDCVLDKEVGGGVIYGSAVIVLCYFM